MISMPLASRILRSEIENVVWVMRNAGSRLDAVGESFCFVVAKKEVRHAMVGGDADKRSTRVYMRRVLVSSPETRKHKKHKV